MDLLTKLNRRHKATLFLTLLAAGVALVLGADVKQASGTVLLGLAFAWAFGSNSRVVHWLFVASGLGLLLFGLGFMFPFSSARSRAAEEQSSKARTAVFDTLRDPSKCSTPPPGLFVTREELDSAFDDASQQNKELVCHKQVLDKEAYGNQGDWFAQNAPKQTGTETVTLRLPSGEVVDAVVPKGMSDDQVKSLMHQKHPEFFQKQRGPSLLRQTSPGWTLVVNSENFLLENPAWKSAIIEKRGPPPFSRIMADWLGGSILFSAPGFVLVCVGLSLIFGVRRAR